MASTTTKAQVETNPRGIPKAPFVEDVEKHIGGPDAEAESSLKGFQEAIGKYKFMESNLGQRRKGLEEKIPDIRKTLEMVTFLKERKGSATDALEEEEPEPLKTNFELNDTLWAEATIKETGSVYLWLGANVMLEYPLEEAVELLANKLGAAERNMKGIIEDLEFLREQITVMEVNTARVYNYDVRRRREEQR